MMMNRRARIVLLAACLTFSAPGCGDGVRPAPGANPRRIVSMAPSLTETLLALDLGDRVVGTTRYCPEVEGALRVGGYFDPSFEAIVALEPDLVLLMQSHDELRRRFEHLGLATFQVDQHDVAGVLGSVTAIADRCGVPAKGRAVAGALRTSLDRVASAVSGRTRPRVLVVVGRSPGGGRIGALWAAAPDTFYDDVVELAGGVNVIEATGIRYPELSREGLLALDPDVIFDVVADGGARGIDPASAAGDWRELDELRAVRDGRVVVLADDFVVIPGPRIVDTVVAVARHLHPEVSWP
jgi:iron complex transport system substrate-binding protein